MNQYITEAIRSQDYQKSSALILKYLRGKLGQKVFPYPIPDVFTPQGGKRTTGIRYFLNIKGPQSVRINWQSTGGKTGAYGVTSLDFFDGARNPQLIPSHHVQFKEEQSLAKVLPLIVDLVKGNLSSGEGVYVTEEISAIHRAAGSLLEDFNDVLQEATYTSGEISKTLSNVIHALQQGMSPRDQHIAGGNKKYGPRWKQIIDFITNNYPDVFRKEGLKRVVEIDKVKKIDANKVLAAVMGGEDAIAFNVSPGSREVPEVDGISEEDQDRMTYEEQLDALKTGMKLLMSNATNAIFLGGRGGCLAGTETVNVRTADNVGV